jgi:phospholipase C
MNGVTAVNIRLKLLPVLLSILAAACSGTASSPPPQSRLPPSSGLDKVNHIIVVMMENHSFDNYFGALAYAPGSPYHASLTGCAPDDHGCVDGLMCASDANGGFVCSNSNPEDSASAVAAFHNTSRCVIPDLEHSWLGSHREANFNAPNAAILDSPNDGFVRANDASRQPDNGVATPTDDSTMGYYTQADLPFYYDLAQKFAIDDRYFSSVMGPTLPNRLYLLAATSFGHVSTGDSAPPGDFKPITGTIFDLLDNAGISWTDYSQDGAEGDAFRISNGSATDPHFQSVQTFLSSAAASAGAAQLPQVAFVDPGFFGPDENDEHPPTDIQRGQAFVSRIVNAVRGGPYWQDSVIFIVYDEHGGFYDHVAPPRASQGSARTPDGIFPGQCADLSNPPASRQPGGGVGCNASSSEAPSLCPALAQSPDGAYPDDCAAFDQLGFRVPFLVVSPFAKHGYVSHTIGDHTSILAFIAERFLKTAGGGSRPHLTLRDQYADTLVDMFDFENAPSLNIPVIQAQPPATDCTPIQNVPTP